MSADHRDAEWLYEHLEVKGLNQREAADKADVAQSTIARWVQKHKQNGTWPENIEEDACVDEGPFDLVHSLELGDKLRIDLADREGWQTPMNVIASDSTTWEAPLGDDFETGVVKIRPGKGSKPKFLLVSADGVSVKTPVTEGPPDLVSTIPVADIERVGTVSPAKRLELLGEVGAVDSDRPAAADERYKQYYPTRAGGESA